MTNKSVNSNPESTPFTINADLLDTPIIVCDNNFKIVYKNRAASYLKLRRSGSYITNYISSNDKLLLKENNFENTPCVYIPLTLNEEQDSSVFAYICSYAFEENSTIWIIPQMINSSLRLLKNNEKFQNNLQSFIPLAAHCIIADKSTNHSPSQNDLAKIIAQKCTLTSINRLFGIAPTDTLAFEYMASILRRFIFEHFSSMGYNITVDLTDTSRLLLVDNSNEFMCLYLNLLMHLLDCSDQPCTNIKFKIEGNMAVIETNIHLKVVPNCKNDLDWLSFTFLNHSLNFTDAYKFCQMLGFDVTILPYNDEIYNCKVLMKSRVYMPGLLCSPSDDDFDVMYNKFIYFLKYI